MRWEKLHEVWWTLVDLWNANADLREEMKPVMMFFIGKLRVSC